MNDEQEIRSLSELMRQERTIGELSAPAPLTIRPGLVIHGNPIQRAQLFAALAEAKGHFDPVVKDRHVVVESNQGRSYEFDYATLDSVLSATDVPLSQHGLSVIDIPVDGALVTLMLHAGGAFIESTQSIPAEKETWVGEKDNRRKMAVPLTIQDIGSAITYRRRYARQCILGIAAEEDDDGNAASGSQIINSQPRTRPTPATQSQAGPSEGPGPGQRSVVAGQKTFSPQDIAALHTEIAALLKGRGLKVPSEEASALVEGFAKGRPYARAPGVLVEIRDGLLAMPKPEPDRAG